MRAQGSFSYRYFHAMNFICLFHLCIRSFRSGSNSLTPRPNWPVSDQYANIPISTEAPKSETDPNALDFKIWKKLGHEFMVKSNINHHIACKWEWLLIHFCSVDVLHSVRRVTIFIQGVNRPHSIYQYSNMAPRLSGQTSKFGIVFFVSKSLLGIERQKKL